MERIGLILNGGEGSTTLQLSDPRTNALIRSQVRQWAGEIFGEVEITELGPPPTADPPGEAPTDTPNSTPFKFCIYDSHHPLPLSIIREKWGLKDTPIIALAYDLAHSHPRHPQVQSANDILRVPMDRLLFLQKVEFLVAQDKAVTPAYLYQTKIDDPNITFELGKQVHVTHISETGCTVISPRPIATGVEGTLSCSLLGSQDSSGVNIDRNVEVRVQESSPYFDSNLASVDQRAPEYEVRMRFFGLRQSQLKNLRTWLAKNIRGGLPEIKRSDDSPKNPMRVALISPRSDSESQLRSSLEQLTKLEIADFAGFRKFTFELMQSLPGTQNSASQTNSLEAFILHHQNFVGPKKLEDLVPLLPRPKLKLRLRYDDLFVEGIEPKLAQEEMLLGAKLDVWERDASTLTKGLDQNDRETFEELLSWVASGTGTQWKSHLAQLDAYFVASPAVQGKIAIHMKLTAPREGTKSPVIEIEIESTALQADKPNTAGRGEKTQFEAILVDASLIQGASMPEFEAKERILALTATCEKFDLRNAFGNPTPIVVFNAKDSLSAKIFRGTKVRQLIHDFSDRRYHAEVFINLSRPELWSSPGLSVFGHRTDIDAALFRPTTLTAISEAGFSISDKIAFKAGTDLQIISSLWPDQKSPLWARVRRTAEAADGLFQEDFFYLGVDDEIQKAIRNFTRNDYVQKKKAE